MTTDLTLSPIGHVRGTEDGFMLVLNAEFIPALSGLDGFSCLDVLWWANLVDCPAYRAFTTCEMPYKNGPEEMGIFATRSPLRPNPIGLTVVTVLHIGHEAGTIYIPYIDAEEGTPILDIKPYHPSTDRVKTVSVPEWCRHWPQWLEDSATFDWAAEFVNAQ